jgi:hypothetical protein
MSILTGRDLEFLASLSTRWRLLYSSELARLLIEDDSRRDARHEPQRIIRIRAPRASR